MNSLGRILVVALALIWSAGQAQAGVVIQNLQVEYRSNPLGIDAEQPRFSWQMAATAGERGQVQSAYQIEVRDPKGTVVWDSGRTESAESLGIRYGGRPLQAATRYAWLVTVWTQAGATLTGGAWFETGLMDPSPTSAAWSGAQWIGGGNDDLVLYSPYLAIFDLRYAVTIAQGSNRAAFVYGATRA
jgi:alpha-L-rhamnosidase